MVRAVLTKGAIQPVEEIPESWHEGQELVIVPHRQRYTMDEARAIAEEWQRRLEGQITSDSADLIRENRDPDEIRAWAREIEEAARRIPKEEHERFRKALAEQREEGKEFVRRQMGLA